MVKRVDNAVSESFSTAMAGNWKSGQKVMGITEGGISWALDDNNKALISDELKAAMDALQAKIVAGDIKVHNTDTDGTCPFL